MAVRIRLKRMGKIRAPFYRVVVMDSRAKRDGRAIEEIGKYHPTEEPSLIEIDSERAQYWLGVGAQPSEQVKALLQITGDWATFSGEGNTEGTLKVKPVATSKKDLYEAAMKASGTTLETKDAPARRKKPAKKAEDEAGTTESAATAGATEPAAAAEPATDEPKA